VVPQESHRPNRKICVANKMGFVSRWLTPALYMRATEDRLIPRSAGKYFARLARAGRVVDLEGPHFLLQARPTLAAAELRKFIREVG
jgi:hypothetical protein